MRITKQKLKQIVKEEIQKALEGKKLDGYSNLPADAKVELIDFINNNLSHEQGPDEWLAAIQRAIQIEPRGVGYKPAEIKIEGNSLFLMYKENQIRSFRLMKKFLDFRSAPGASKMSTPSGLVHVETKPTEVNPFYTLEIKKPQIAKEELVVEQDVEQKIDLAKSTTKRIADNLRSELETTAEESGLDISTLGNLVMQYMKEQG